MNLWNWLNNIKKALLNHDDFGDVIIGFVTPEQHGSQKFPLVAIVLPENFTFEDNSYYDIPVTILVYFFENSPSQAIQDGLQYLNSIRQVMGLCYPNENENIKHRLISMNIAEGIRYMGEAGKVVDISNPFHAVSATYEVRINETVL